MYNNKKVYQKGQKEKIQIHTVQFKNFHVQAKEVMYHVFGDGCGSCHKSDTPVKSKGFPHFFVDDFLADTKRKKRCQRVLFWERLTHLYLCTGKIQLHLKRDNLLIKALTKQEETKILRDTTKIIYIF